MGAVSKTKWESKGGVKADRKKRKFNIKKFSVALVVMCFAFYFIYTLIWQQVTISKKNEEIDALQQQITSAAQDTEKLQKELDNLNDPEYLERIAREKLGLVFPNERVFVDANKSASNQGD